MLASTIGWLGMILLITGYYLISANKIKSSSATYQLLNVLGGSSIACHTFVQKAWPAFALNVLWASIALFTLLTLAKPKK